MAKTNVVILSKDYNLKTAISEAVKKEPEMTVNTNCFDIATAQSNFMRNTANVLVLDVEYFKFEYRFLKALTEKYMLFVVMVGRKALFADPSFPFVAKLASQSQGSMYTTAAVVMQKIKSKSILTPSFAMRDVARYVDAKSKLIAMTSSTGGTEALSQILPTLPKDIAPLVIVQHMPSMFTSQLADRIDKMSEITVKEARDGEMLKVGTAYIAPGDLHMRLVVRQRCLAVECFYGDKKNGVRPAADILFETVAQISGPQAVGVILTGMGSDGARGLVEMKKKGAVVIGQDKATSIVYGMPRAAYELGAVDYQLPLSDIPRKIMELGM